MDPFFELQTWQRAFGLAFLELSTVVYIGYLALTVVFFRQRETGFGIVCAICALLAPPIGILIGLVFGWARAGRWQKRGFMTLWTLLILLATLNLAAVVVLRDMPVETWLHYFGPREPPLDGKRPGNL